MKVSATRHATLAQEQSFPPLLWLLVCIGLWALGIMICMLTIEELYFR